MIMYVRTDQLSLKVVSTLNWGRSILGFTCIVVVVVVVVVGHPALKRQDRLGKEPFAGFGTVVEDITESGYTKNQPILLGFF